MIKNNKKFYYCNVYFFCKRIRNLIIIKNKKIVRVNLNICLRSLIFIWYIAELKLLKHFNFRNFEIDESWIKKFKQRFKLNYIATINLLIIERYIIIDIQNNCKSFNYIQQVVNYAKNVNFQNIQQQLIWAWKNFNFNLKRNISTLIEFITLSNFVITIKNKKKYNKSFITFAIITKIIVIIVVLIVKLISKFYDKLTIVKTIINRSTMFMLFIFIIRRLIIIKIKILFTIIKNINIKVLINNQITFEINNYNNRLFSRCSYLIFNNFCV